MLKYKTKKAMLSKASSFLDIQNQYFSNQLNNVEMTQITTQPFWQSMHLSKKRLTEKGLVSETTIQKAIKPMTFIHDASNERSEIGLFNQPVKEQKKIYHNGKIIYDKKDDKIITVSAIKALGDEENACCPNCGHLGKISSYIDGCDYCNSKFSVTDFEEKISSFCLVENTPKKVLQIFKKLALVIGIIAVVLGILSVVSIIMAIIFSMAGSSSALESASLVIFMFSTELSPVFWKIFNYTGILFIIILILAFILLGQRINKTKIITDRIDHFSPEDFAQNLEFKLRNIHFASDAKEVNAYATFDLGSAIANYKDVIECTLSKLTFKNIQKQDDLYYIDVDLICALTQYCNNKIQVESEKIAVTLSAPSTLNTQNLNSIHCYYCPNCSGTISLLNGGVCDYCGTKLDYSKHSWMIEKYESKGKVANPFSKIKWLLLAIYGTVFIATSAIILSSHSDMLYYLAHYDECVEFSYTTYDTVAGMNEVVPGVLLDTSTDDSTLRTCFYSTVNSGLTAMEAAKAYCQYLSSEGFHLKDKTDNSRTYYKVISNSDLRLEGHFEMEIRFDNKENAVKVEYCIDDSPYEEE